MRRYLGASVVVIGALMLAGCAGDGTAGAAVGSTVGTAAGAAAGAATGSSVDAADGGSVDAAARATAAATPTGSEPLAEPVAEATEERDPPDLICSTEAERQMPECSTPYAAPPRPGQLPMSEKYAVAEAYGYSSVPNAPAEARLMPFAHWVSTYGLGTDMNQVPRDRPIWVVSVEAVPVYPFTGPPGTTPPAADSYTVLIDSYSGWVLSFSTIRTVFTD